MAPIEVIPVSIVRRYVDDRERLTVEGWSGRTVKELLEELGIPSVVVTGVLIDGRLKSKSYQLQDGDEVKLIPVLGGG